jgi:TonB family protein
VITHLLLVPALIAGGSQQGLADFTARIQAYLDVRRAAVQTVPAPAITADRAATIATTDALAAAIRRARADARIGDILTPQVAIAIRAAIARGCAQRFDELRREIAAETPVPLARLAVNDRWPIGDPLPTMPPDVLEALPPLPPELEYRFAGTSLVLRDMDANLIVDIVRDAIPPAGEILPARLVTGGVAPIPLAVLGGGEVFLEITIDLEGRVAGVKTLRSTPPLTGLVADAVRTWQFEPSQKAVQYTTDMLHFFVKTTRVSTVLVGAVFRPPSINAPTLGRLPMEVGTSAVETAFPAVVKMPALPLNAFGAGVVLVEVHVDADGTVSDTCILESSPPFDGPALDAARQFRFRPARVEGAAVPSYVYLLFGFPLPITHETAR